MLALFGFPEILLQCCWHASHKWGRFLISPVVAGRTVLKFPVMMLQVLAGMHLTLRSALCAGWAQLAART